MKAYLGEELKEDEYLLKIRPGDDGEESTGFLTKFNKDGSMPKAFIDWPRYYRGEEPLPIYLHEEIFRSGWKITDYRAGESRSWGLLRHPHGYELEVYLQNMFDIINTHTVVDGYIVGEFKWSYSELIEKK